MKYNIFDFNQEKVISLSKKTIDNGKDRIISLDVSDLLILKIMEKHINSYYFKKYFIENKIYTSIQYRTILDDLPILKIKKQALVDRINKMVYLNLLDIKIIKNKTGSFSTFRFGDKYKFIRIGYKELSEYKKQLKSKEWKNFRKKVFKIKGKKCEICGSTKQLNIHHPFYTKGKLAWQYNPSDMMVLCRYCHKEIHNIK